MLGGYFCHYIVVFTVIIYAVVAITCGKDDSGRHYVRKDGLGHSFRQEGNPSDPYAEFCDMGLCVWEYISVHHPSPQKQILRNWMRVLKIRIISIQERFRFANLGRVNSSWSYCSNRMVWPLILELLVIRLAFRKFSGIEMLDNSNSGSIATIFPITNKIPLFHSTRLFKLESVTWTNPSKSHESPLDRLQGVAIKLQRISVNCQ